MIVERRKHIPSGRASPVAEVVEGRGGDLLVGLIGGGPAARPRGEGGAARRPPLRPLVGGGEAPGAARCVLKIGKTLF